MKKTTLFLIIFFSFLLFFLYLNHTREKNTNIISENPRHTSTSSTSTSPLKPKKQENKKLLFVPYWTIGNGKIKDEGFSDLVYFGISVNNDGVNKNDLEFKKIENFIKNTNKNKKKFLGVKMTDSRTNSIVLSDKNLQKKIISESINVARENLFDGIVLDFEISALSFDLVIKDINNFFSSFYKESKNGNLNFIITIYGDNFYRLRPYDMAFLSKNTDKVLIMAYDFHKSGGNPGPNFPLSGREEYGYDFKEMIDDYLKKVSTDKIIVVFGLFGYDWEVDETGDAIGVATPMSKNQIETKFKPLCKFKNCNINKDSKSLETKISYEDSDFTKHIVWYEDMESVEKKIKFLEEKGINSIGFWAYSFF